MGDQCRGLSADRDRWAAPAYNRAMPLSRRSWSRVVLGLAALAAVGCRLQSRGTPVADETAAPEFSLPDQDGNVTSLAGMRANGPVVLVFYRGHW